MSLIQIGMKSWIFLCSLLTMTCDLYTCTFNYELMAFELFYQKWWGRKILEALIMKRVIIIYYYTRDPNKYILHNISQFPRDREHFSSSASDRTVNYLYPCDRTVNYFYHHLFKPYPIRIRGPHGELTSWK